MLKKNYKSLLAAALITANFAAKADCVFEQSITTKEFGVGLMLNWMVSEETNNQMFVVEKSENGVEFTNAGTVKAAGTHRTTKSYNFLDARAGGAMKVFYRLKQVDFDGTYSFSEVAVVNRKQANNLVVVQMSSETTTRLFSCAIDAFTEGVATLKLVDGTGKVVAQSTKNITNGLNTVNVDFDGQRDGTYKLVVSLNGEEETLVVRKTLDEIEKRVNVATNRRALKSN